MSNNEIETSDFLALISNIIDESTFDKICHWGYNEFDDYNYFYNYCVSCINDMSNSEKIWLNVFCNKMNDGMINLVNIEDCIEYNACSFYFNKDRQLCIVHPRLY